MSEPRKLATLYLPMSVTQVVDTLNSFEKAYPNAVVKYDGDPQAPEIWSEAPEMAGGSMKADARTARDEAGSGGMTRHEAACYVVDAAAEGGTLFAVPAVLSDEVTRQKAYRIAAKRPHPDANGGDDAAFKELQKAMGLLISA